MDVLLKRREIMMANSTPSYITDGLVFRLDGIDKGTTDTSKWVDLIGGIVFTEAGGGNVHSSNCISVTTTQRLVGDTALDYPSTTCTIECAISNVSNNWVFVLRNLNGKVSAFIDSNQRFQGGSNGIGYRCSTNATRGYLMGMANDTCVIDGQTEQTTLASWGNFASGMPVINSLQPASNSYSKDNDIYSIRIYNRLLTAAEMLHNQQVDNARFNLGLTI